jgi:hypothetical protein
MDKTTTNERCPDCGRPKGAPFEGIDVGKCLKHLRPSSAAWGEDCAAHKARASTDKKPVCARCNDTGEIACYPDDAPCPACWKAGRINPNADARASVQDAGAPSGKERFVIEWLTDLAQQLGNGCDGDTARAALDLVKEALQHRADSPAVSAQDEGECSTCEGRRYVGTSLPTDTHDGDMLRCPDCNVANHSEAIELLCEAAEYRAQYIEEYFVGNRRMQRKAAEIRKAIKLLVSAGNKEACNCCETTPEQTAVDRHGNCMFCDHHHSAHKFPPAGNKEAGDGN